MSHAEKHETVKKLNCCFNCLPLGHGIRACTRGNYRKCGKKHHTLLHWDAVPPNSVEVSDLVSRAVSVDSSTQPCVPNSASIESNYTVLFTAIVLLENSVGEFHEC